MTAEIAIMNKSAIALAADSSVTIMSQVDRKIYNTINKLFMLSKYNPVGIMMYGNAEFMGIPWESIIKIYRANLGKTKFDSLVEYAESFVNFLNGENPLFSEPEQEKYFAATAYAFYSGIKDEINGKVKALLEKKTSITASQVAEIVTGTIDRLHTELENSQSLPNIPDGYVKATLEKYNQVIKNTTGEIFQKLPISEESFNKLQAIAVNLIIKDHFPANTSGIVVAGFGDKETFPSIILLNIDGIANNRLKYKQDKGKSTRIGADNMAAVIPFAQSEVVEAFMEGVDPMFVDIVEGYFSEIFHKYPENIIDGISKLTAKEKQGLKAKLKKAGESIHDTFVQTIQDYKQANHVDPIITAVSFLPKEDLAAMAESLVNLTLFKRRISIDAEESVGGAIDVAVISKGDGFVWIKRKSYFRPELNPAFNQNYFDED